MKKLACWLGRHEWTTRVEEGESWPVCAACGKTPRHGPAPEEHDAARGRRDSRDPGPDSAGPS